MTYRMYLLYTNITISLSVITALKSLYSKAVIMLLLKFSMIKSCTESFFGLNNYMKVILFNCECVFYIFIGFNLI